MKKYDNIPGFPGYFVSKHGRVYSRILPRGRSKNRVYSNTWRKLKPYLRKSNHKFQVSLYDCEGNLKTIQVHKLVAKIYVPNPHNYPCVCHKDDIGTHNDYTNLVWGTVKDNVRMMIENHKLRGLPLKSFENFKRLDTRGKNNGMYGSIRISSRLGFSLKDIYTWYKRFKKGEPIKNIVKDYPGSNHKMIKRKINLIDSDPKKYLSYLKSNF